MNEVWNLDPIYKGFDDPAFEADLASLKAAAAKMAETMGKLPEMAPIDGLKAGIAAQEETAKLVQKLYGYASLRQSANTKDPEAGSQLGRVMATLSGVAAPMAAFESWASSLPNLMELVEGDEELKDYRYLFANMVDILL